MAVKEKLVFWLHGEVKTPPFSVAARREAGGLLGFSKKTKTTPKRVIDTCKASIKSYEKVLKE